MRTEPQGIWARLTALGGCLGTSLLLLGSIAQGPAAPAAFSQSPLEVLRRPVSPEELVLSQSTTEWIVSGPTFTYRVQKSSGAIRSLRVALREHELFAGGPAEIDIDGFRLTSESTPEEVRVDSNGKEKIVVRARVAAHVGGKPGTQLECSLVHTFYNDGVVVSKVVLVPEEDLPVTNALRYSLPARGQFSHWLHKKRDEHGGDAARGSLPEPRKAVRLSALTSCLQVFSPEAGMALFTDCGATYLSRPDLETAIVEVLEKDQNRARVSLSQYLIHIEPGKKPYVLKAGEQFTFRVGISVAPNRIPHPRLHDLRMFAWIGDQNYPYPSNEEIAEAAKAGYTLFQMHRLGTPGEPRPPAGELERVIQKVHELGMLFLWTENADLMYDSAPGVQELKAQGKFDLWQGFNYGGRYKASMDPYCDLVATCLASPNGLAEYRLKTYGRMMDRFAVDGMYVDDNLAYANCKLSQEHGHPQPVYDCLIELHEMNWQRRQLLRQRCPHAVLVSHNTRAMVLPVVCDFDALLYGEGYSFSSLQNYWDYFRPANAVPAQGMIWPGGEDHVRCPAALAYNYDLLTGGGQYCEIDWRMFPKKFPYGAGVTDAEQFYVRNYNLAQYYFGLYESTPYYFADSTALFATTAPQTYATIYRNNVWPEWLIPVANMGPEVRKTSLRVQAPEPLGLKRDREYTLFNILERTARTITARDLDQAFSSILVRAQELELFLLRERPQKGAYHLWGGKRLSEIWDSERFRLEVKLQGPPGVQETVFLGIVSGAIERVNVDRKPASFFFDSTQGLAHGAVTFGPDPVILEVICSRNGPTGLPAKSVSAVLSPTRN